MRMYKEHVTYEIGDRQYNFASCAARTIKPAGIKSVYSLLVQVVRKYQVALSLFYSKLIDEYYIINNN